MSKVRWLALTLAVVGCAASPRVAVARDFVVRSFDGTRIAGHLFPAKGLLAGQRAPTVLVGAGWGSAAETNVDSASDIVTGALGLGPLRAAGYNVVTWDPRGFGSSGGESHFDAPDFEARDVQALLDYVARQPEALLDSPGDPRVGMTGGSYGGAIQFLAAAIDSRIDAITPSHAWHSLLTTLYKDRTLKAGWLTVICGMGIVRSAVDGLVAPFGARTGTLDPIILDTCATGMSIGEIPDRAARWLAAHGPAGDYINRVRTPTLIVQGSGDTLTTLDEATANYRILRVNRVPVRMMWFCGGHTRCLTAAGPAGYVQGAILRWFARYLEQDRHARVGPGFEWIDQLGHWHQAREYRPQPRDRVVATGHGNLELAALGGLSPARVDKLTIALPSVSSPTDIVGTPELELAYTGDALPSDVRVFAQVIDTTRHLVVGNQSTPIPLVLDGKPRTARRPLEALALQALPGDDYRLQIVPATPLYTTRPAVGRVRISRMTVSLPVR